jgi:ERCC4-type nuclease
MRVRITIDMRETDLWDALAAWHLSESEGETSASKQDGWCVVKAPLDIGDIAFHTISMHDSVECASEQVILERKTAEDLGASQRDGRYREQRTRLLARKGAGIRIGYLIEAPTWSPTLSRSWCRGQFTEVHLQSAILRLQLRYGISVFQSSSVKESVQWIRRIATALVADPTVFQTGVLECEKAVAAAYTDAIHVKKSANMDADRILHTMLRTLPGVGVTAADAIVQHTKGIFSTFFGMSAEELAVLPIGDGKRKLGKVLASRIWNIFHGPREEECTK